MTVLPQEDKLIVAQPFFAEGRLCMYSHQLENSLFSAASSYLEMVLDAEKPERAAANGNSLLVFMVDVDATIVPNENCCPLVNVSQRSWHQTRHQTGKKE